MTRPSATMLARRALAERIDGDTSRSSLGGRGCMYSIWRDGKCLALQFHRFVSATDAKKWRDVHGIQGDEFWTVSFASHHLEKS